LTNFSATINWLQFHWSTRSILGSSQWHHVTGMVLCCHFHFWLRMGRKMLASKSWHFHLILSQKMGMLGY